jgi:hypothetical protein
MREQMMLQGTKGDYVSHPIQVWIESSKAFRDEFIYVPL